MPRSSSVPRSRRGAALGLAILVLVGLVAAVETARASAQQATGFMGAVTLDGKPAAVGTKVEVFLNGAPAGSSVVISAGNYVVDLSGDAAKLGKDMDGAGVSFRVNGVSASETGALQLGRFLQVDLSAAQAGPSAQR